MVCKTQGDKIAALAAWVLSASIAVWLICLVVSRG